jgi:hypothetical protein
MRLFTPAWNSDNKEKRITAVKKEIAKNNEKKLIKIATEAKYYDVRKITFEKVENESTLAVIAKNDENISFRKLAIGKISDNVVLADIAKNDESVIIREIAKEKITDESVLADIDKTRLEREFKVKKLKNGTYEIIEYKENSEKVNIPDIVSKIGEKAFQDSKIQYISLSDNICEIGDYAFTDSEIKQIIFPPNVIIGKFAFDGCKYLNNIKLQSIPPSTIPKGCFTDCKSLKRVEIPEGVSKIEEFAFYRCESLTSISLPKSLTMIGFGAFGDCKLNKVSATKHILDKFKNTLFNH